MAEMGNIQYFPPRFGNEDDYVRRGDLLTAEKLFYARCKMCGIMESNEGFMPEYWAITVRNVIDVPAADVAKVVRCKDCLSWKKDAYGGVCDRYGVRIDKYWFCAGGEHREDQDGL